MGHFRTTAVKWSLLAEGPPSPSESHIAHEAHTSGCACAPQRESRPFSSFLSLAGLHRARLHISRRRGRWGGVLTWIHSPSLVSIPDICFPLIVYRE